MQRRKFFISSLLALPALALGRPGFGQSKSTAGGANKSFMVRANESRFWGKQMDASDKFIHCKISTVDTDGGLLFGTTTAKVNKFRGGPALHVHYKHDEIFYVASGEFIIQLGDEFFLAKSGDTAFVARGTPHTYANPVENNPGTLLSIYQPAPKIAEEYFAYIADNGRPSPQIADPDSPELGPTIDIDAALEKIKEAKN